MCFCCASHCRRKEPHDARVSSSAPAQPNARAPQQGLLNVEAPVTRAPCLRARALCVGQARALSAFKRSSSVRARSMTSARRAQARAAARCKAVAHNACAPYPGITVTDEATASSHRATAPQQASKASIEDTPHPHNAARELENNAATSCGDQLSVSSSRPASLLGRTRAERRPQQVRRERAAPSHLAHTRQQRQTFFHARARAFAAAPTLTCGACVQASFSFAARVCARCAWGAASLLWGAVCARLRLLRGASILASPSSRFWPATAFASAANAPRTPPGRISTSAQRTRARRAARGRATSPRAPTIRGHGVATRDRGGAAPRGPLTRPRPPPRPFAGLIEASQADPAPAGRPGRRAFPRDGGLCLAHAGALSVVSAAAAAGAARRHDDGWWR